MEAILTGIISDTSRFMILADMMNSFEYAYKFIKCGVNYNKIVENIYTNLTEERVRFLGHLLLNRLSLIKELHTAIITISKEDMQPFNIKNPNTDNILAILMRIKNIYFSATILELDNGTKISLRSRGEIDAGKIARNDLNGGGHKHAASGIIPLPFKQAIPFFYQILNKYKTFLINPSSRIHE